MAIELSNAERKELQKRLAVRARRRGAARAVYSSVLLD